VDLAAISGWNRRWLADGVQLAPPGSAGDWLRIRTDQRPLRAFCELLGDSAYGELERFTTVEGEYAGLVLLAEPGRIRVVAMVVGDDSYVLIEGHTRDPLRAGWWRDLVHTVARFYPLGLGKPRRRRFPYRPPGGWQGVPRAGCVAWIDPEFPKVSGRISVFHARPLEWYVPGAVDRLMFVDENPFSVVERTNRPVEFMVRAGFGGSSTTSTGRTADGTRIAMTNTLLRDERYLYALQLHGRQSEWDAFVPVYEELVRSIEPLPSGELDQPAQHLVHWIE
jgi:hypothetical protein